MGKAGRRNKSRQKRNPISAESDDGTFTAVASSSTNPQSAVQRLRHADPKVRHEALVALQASVLSQLHCASHKPVSMKVLQAVREQVTSNDLECSAVAADCLAQYLTAISSNNKKNYASNNSDQQKQITASWALVLLGRLDDCRKALAEQQQSSKGKGKLSKNQQKKAEKTKKQWYAVSAPCFIALCQLIEDNGHALDRINLQKKTFVEVVMGMLILECQSPKVVVPSSSDETAMEDAGEDASTPHDAIFAELRDITALYAARCLHSALDDNQELAGALDSGGDQDNLWRNLLGGGHLLPTMTRLHLIGCLVNLYQMSLQNGEDHKTTTSSWQEEIILEHGIQGSNNNSEGLLLEVLLSNQLPTQLAENEAKYRAAQALLEKQQQDQKMEEEVDAKVRERKEPAKLIAKRQKKVKEAKREESREQQKAKMIADAEAEMGGGDDADMADASEAGKITQITQEQDGEEARNEALLEFTSITGPIQLGLEIFTNLVSTWIGDVEDDPMGGGGGSGSGGRSSTLFRAIQTQNMASKLADTLQTLSQFLRTCQATTTTSSSSVDPIRNDVEETIGVISAGVMNCFLSGILYVEGTPSGSNESILWNATLKDLRIELDYPNYRSTAVFDACASILAVAVEMNPGILRTSGEQYLALFKDLLTHFPRADVVCLVSSAVLAEAKTEDAVRSVTEDFLGFLYIPIESDDTKIQTSVLKAFMDWYGNDGFHPHLYEGLNVSAAIEGALMFLANERKDQDDMDEEQLQILHNSERFVDYKKQFKLQAR
jgi:hypothetical protein